MVSPQTDILERVGVAESPEPAAAVERAEEVLPPTLAQRMAAVRRECFGIGKTDIEMESKSGAKFRIKGHTVEAVLSEVRPLLDKHGVDLTPNLESISYTGNRCDIIVGFEFESIDDCNDRRVVRWAGCGTDNGDKAFSKAGTNALKEMLKKVFLITDRDDAKEEEDKVEHKPEGGASRADVDQAKERAERAIQQWATAFKAALDSASTEKEIDRLQTDNREQLADPSLAPVTRQFFFDHIQRRKAEVKAK